MIILIKNESEIGYKITFGRVEVEKGVELGLDGIGREGVGEWWMGMRDNGSEKFLFFKILFFKIENFLIFLKILFSRPKYMSCNIK